MGRYTDEQLSRMVGYSPEELATMNMSDAEFERKGAALLAAHAETRHQLDMEKVAGLAAINSTQYDPEVLAGARRIHNQNPAGPTVAEIIELQVIPIREKYLEQFNSEAPAPAAPTKAGANEMAFNKLIGEDDG